MIELQYLETARQSVWRKGARMHPAGLENLKDEALALMEKNSWYAVQIVADGFFIAWQRKNRS